MPEDRYNNREIDSKHQAVLEKIDNLQNVLELKISTFENDTRQSLQTIEAQVGYTNGKVRKIIIALIFIGGLTIGLGFDKADLLIGLLQTL
jgi:hypothetical protein